MGQFLDEYTAMVSNDPAGAIERHRASSEKTRKLVRKLNRPGGMPQLVLMASLIGLVFSGGRRSAARPDAIPRTGAVFAAITRQH